MGSMVAGFLTPDQLASRGWRVPFLLGALVAVSGLLVRRAIPAEAAPAAAQASPVRDLIGKHRKPALQVILLNIGQGVAFFAAFIYAVSDIKVIDALPAQIAFNNNTEAMVALLLLPCSAWLADRIGRKPKPIAGAAIVTFGAFPFLHRMHAPDPAAVFRGEFGFAFGFAVMSGAVVVHVELIPHAARCTCLAVGYNVAVGLFVGTAPMIAAWLIHGTGDPMSPTWWVAGTASITLATAALVPAIAGIRSGAFRRIAAMPQSPLARWG